jgi:hypothetical protein
MRRSWWLWLLLFGFGLTGATCNKETDDVLAADDCSGPLLKTEGHSVVHDGQIFTIATPEAAGDCTASYYLWIRWADPIRRATDEHPPIMWSFSPDVSPFPTTLIRSGAQFSQYPPEGGWWVLNIPAPTPTSAGGNHTVFSIQIDRDLTPDIRDSVEVYGYINYRIAP